MSSWFPEKNLSWLEWFGVQVLKTGQIPHHVAIIMDGNRRFARKHHTVLNKGHESGFNKLIETLKWCKEFGIRELTVYAFSIENFKRAEDEVNGLLNLAREKFEILWKDREKLRSEGVKVCALGDISRMPLDIQKAIAKVVLFSQNNNKFVINMCIAYTGREELKHAIARTNEGTKLGLIQPEDIDEHLLHHCLHTSDSFDPDLIIRTSGETRLSDFLLWQSSYSILAFVDVLWPDFSIWNLMMAIFYYQRNVEHSKKFKEMAKKRKKTELIEEKTSRVEKFLNYVVEKRIQNLNDLLSH